MRVYHGSYTEINEIDLTFSRTSRDFGQGFYVTRFREQAEYWAKKKGERKGNNAFVPCNLCKHCLFKKVK